MVKSFYTAIADSAVSGSRSAQNEAVWTHFARMDLLEEFEEVVALAEVARIFGRGDKEANRDNWTESSNDVGKHVVVLLWQDQNELSCYD